MIGSRYWFHFCTILFLIDQSNNALVSQAALKIPLSNKCTFNSEISHKTTDKNMLACFKRTEKLYFKVPLNQNGYNLFTNL